MVTNVKQNILWRRRGSWYRFVCGTVLLAFGIGIIGIGAGWGMQMDQNGSMRDCVFMRGEMQGFCPMQLADHVTDWRLLFGTLPQREILLLLVLGIVVAAFARLRVTQKTSLLVQRFLWYDRARVHQRIFMPLQVALARGIVQPKIWA